MSSYLSLLRRESTSVVAVELRPPRAELEAAEGMDAWIDTYHAIRSLTRHDVRVMVTDSAVGAQEENNLRHLVANLGDAVGRHKVIPFLTTKHSLEFCLALRRSGGAQRLSVARRARRRQARRPAAIARARVAAAPADSRASSRPRARRLGQSDRRSAQAGRFPAAAGRQRGFLPDADRLAPPGRSRRRVPRGRPIERAGDARRVRRVLLPQRQPRRRSRC